jgi:hypothetical protein
MKSDKTAKYDPAKTVTVVMRKGAATLVEYEDDGGLLRRSSVPSSAILSTADDGRNATVDIITLDQGIPYGIPFEHRIKNREVTAEKIAEELHKVGIWTAMDIVNNPRGVHEAILSSVGVTLSDILNLAQEFLNKEK